MLVLGRKHGQEITIGDDVVITVVRIGNGNVRLGVTAPKSLDIKRPDGVVREETDVVKAYAESPSAQC